MEDDLIGKMPSYREDEMYNMVHTALQLRADIDNHPVNKNALMTDDNCLPPHHLTLSILG